MSACEATKADGSPCRAAPIIGEHFCHFHSPDHRESADAARRLAGQRRHRESTIITAVDLEDLRTTGGLLRLWEVIVTDVLAQENSLRRAEVLIAALNAGTRLQVQLRIDERVAELERAMSLQEVI